MNVADNDDRLQDTLRITEIFLSLQGESKTVGIPTVFVRLTGCPLRCQYCDTAYAFTGGTSRALQEIVDEVKSHKVQYVTVTGGEPLAQKNCLKLMSLLCDEGCKVSLETSGALSLAGVDERVTKVMDIKTPGSGEVERNNFENLQLISHGDQIKFVICDERDYSWSKEVIEKYNLTDKCEILMSPSFAEIKGEQLADWILRDHLPVRFQLQLHKILWGDQPGR